MHFEFPYRGGEVFTFKGDDDVWLFVNGRLAIDLGGVHGVMTGTVDLDQSAASLGITPGQTYRMDIFHAERHTWASNFRIETTLACINNVVIP
jgi:fibro-slime domain-containing protein